MFKSHSKKQYKVIIVMITHIHRERGREKERERDRERDRDIHTYILCFCYHLLQFRNIAVYWLARLFPSLLPVLERGFESWLGLEFLGFRMWHFLKLVVRGFLRVLQLSPLLHWLTVSANKIKLKSKINAISSLSHLIAELFLGTTWYTTCCM